MGNSYIDISVLEEKETFLLSLLSGLIQKMLLDFREKL